MRLKSKLLKLLGLDFHVFYTLAYRFWNIVAGGLSVLLLPWFLSPVEQGYFFTFGSLLALQVFFELGLNQIVVQLVSHEIVNLIRQPNGEWVGADEAKRKLAGLLAFLRKWFAIAASVFMLAAGSLGWFFFSGKTNESTIGWIGPWLVVVLATSINLWLSPLLAVHEGLGRVGNVARLRLCQSALGFVFLWGSLLAGGGLWSVVMVPAASALLTWIWIGVKVQHVPNEPAKSCGNVLSKLNWVRDVFPLQWRMALSWVSGYFIFNLFTPLTFSTWGPDEAGKLGLSLTIFSSITTLGMSWVNARYASMGALVASDQRSKLNGLFKTLIWRAVLFNLLISGVFIAVVMFLSWTGADMVNRVSSVEILAMLGGVAVSNTIVFSLATYMRAHREEPMLLLSLVVATLTGLATYISIEISVSMAMISYLSINWLIALPWTVILWKSYSKRTANCAGA